VGERRSCAHVPGHFRSPFENTVSFVDHCSVPGGATTQEWHWLREPRAAFATAGLGCAALWCVEEWCWRLASHRSEPGAFFATLAALSLAAGLMAGAGTFLLPRRIAVAVPVFLAVTFSAGSALESTLAWRGPLAVAAAAPVGVAVALGVSSVRWPRGWLLPVAAVALTCAPGLGPRGARAARNPHQPDIVMIVMDTTRRDHLSVYGYPQPTTPALERLGQDAAVYDDAWSVAPWTAPSHASMLSGLLPAQHGVDGRSSPAFPPDVVSLPRLLSARGYHTGGFVANPNLAAPGWAEQFAEYRPPFFRGRHFLIRVVNRFALGSEDPWVLGSATGRVFAHARVWWATHGDASRFVLINVMDPHEPYRPPLPYYRQFLGDVEATEAYAVDQDPLDSHARPGFTPRQRSLVTRLYDAEIRAMDEHIGSFLEWLRGRGELDRTLVVVTADHGERLGERGLLGHEALMDPYLLRVPLIVRYPPTVRPEHVRRRVQLDGLPGYVLHLAGVPQPPVMSRHRLDRQDQVVVVAQHRMPEWFEGSMRRRRPDMDVAPFRGDWYFVADARFAYVCSLTNPHSPLCMLDDLEGDPEWTRDASGEHPEVSRALAERGRQLPAYRALGEPVTADPELLERLRSLGYAN
jgi:arylsulfatase A-like enzyme